jgi:hypothetical protein
MAASLGLADVEFLGERLIEPGHRVRVVASTLDHAAREHIDTRLETRLFVPTPHENFRFGVTFAVDDETGGVSWGNNGSWHFSALEKTGCLRH